MFLQETIIPSASNKTLFLIAPIITFTVALLAWAVIPFSDGMVLANINGRPALYSRDQLAGRLWRHSRGLGVQLQISLLFAIRASAQMISYEVSIGFVLICVVLWAGSFNLSTIVEAQKGHDPRHHQRQTASIRCFSPWPSCS